MSDKAIENAKALKSQANRELERLEAEIRLWRDHLARADQFIDQWNSFASGVPANLTIVSAEENKSATSVLPKKATRNSRKEVVAETARKIILDRGVPVSRSDLFKELIAAGLTIEGTDPEMVLSTMLWRMKDRIARVKNGGYWPADIPNTDADYDPVTSTEFDTVLNMPGEEIVDPDSDAAAEARRRVDE